jgi:hypothetical protein
MPCSAKAAAGAGAAAAGGTSMGRAGEAAADGAAYLSVLLALCTRLRL